jgi:hypothetical protein
MDILERTKLTIKERKPKYNLKTTHLIEDTSRRGNIQYNSLNSFILYSWNILLSNLKFFSPSIDTLLTGLLLLSNLAATNLKKCERKPID